jgi:dUTP pyrophosphatase
MNIIKVKRLTETAILPTRASEGDAGLDLYADVEANISTGRVTKVSTGISVEIPYGYVGLVHPRSGLAAKEGITVVNAPGTIDAGYRGEVMVLLTSIDDRHRESIFGYRVKPTERIAQLVIQKVELPEVEEVDELSDSVRGVGGFGSSGA